MDKIQESSEDGVEDSENNIEDKTDDADNSTGDEAGEGTADDTDDDTNDEVGESIGDETDDGAESEVEEPRNPRRSTRLRNKTSLAELLILSKADLAQAQMLKEDGEEGIYVSIELTLSFIVLMFLISILYILGGKALEPASFPPQTAVKSVVVTHHASNTTAYLLKSTLKCF